MPKNVQVNPRIIKKSYTDPSTVGAFRSLAVFAKARKIKSIKKLENELQKIRSYTLHKRSWTNIPRRPIIVKKPLELIQIDLIDMQKYRHSNRNFAYILTCIDLYTKLAFAAAVKTKSPKHIVPALDEMIKFYKGKILNISSDSGLEFFSKQSKSFFHKHNINHYATFSNLKAVSVERFNQTLKRMIFKYFTEEKTKRWENKLKDFLYSYNNTPHNSHGFAPAKIKKSDYDQVLTNLYSKYASMKPPVPRYKPNDKVRISVKKFPFQKKYLAQYSEEIFTIKSIHTDFPVVSYKLQDSNFEELQGTFVEGELSKVAPE